MIIRFKYDDYKAKVIADKLGIMPFDASTIEDLTILNEFEHRDIKDDGYHQTRDREIYYVDVERYRKMRSAKKNSVHPYTDYIIQRAITQIDTMNHRDDLLSDLLDEPKVKLKFSIFNWFKK